MNLSLLDVAYLKNRFDYDSFEHYSNVQLLSGLNKGYLWSGAFCDKSGIRYPGLQSYDDFQSYSNGSALLGLSNGTGWNGNFYDK